MGSGVVMIAELVAIVVLAVLVLAALLALRRLRILRRGGVDVGLRSARDVEDPRGWHSGIGRYRGDEFRWYRVSGIRRGPTVVLDRTVLEILDRRPASGTEAHPDLATASVLRCRSGERTWELTMDAPVLTGFSSWLESIPPGRSTGYRQAS